MTGNRELGYVDSVSSVMRLKSRSLNFGCLFLTRTAHFVLLPSMLQAHPYYNTLLYTLHENFMRILADENNMRTSQGEDTLGTDYLIIGDKESV